MISQGRKVTPSSVQNELKPPPTLARRHSRPIETSPSHVRNIDNPFVLKILQSEEFYTQLTEGCHNSAVPPRELGVATLIRTDLAIRKVPGAVASAIKIREKIRNSLRHSYYKDKNRLQGEIGIWRRHHLTPDTLRGNFLLNSIIDRVFDDAKETDGNPGNRWEYLQAIFQILHTSPYIHCCLLMTTREFRRNPVLPEAKKGTASDSPDLSIKERTLAHQHFGKFSSFEKWRTDLAEKLKEREQQNISPIKLSEKVDGPYIGALAHLYSEWPDQIREIPPQFDAGRIAMNNLSNYLTSSPFYTWIAQYMGYLLAHNLHGAGELYHMYETFLTAASGTDPKVDQGIYQKYGRGIIAAFFTIFRAYKDEYKPFEIDVALAMAIVSTGVVKDFGQAICLNITNRVDEMISDQGKTLPIETHLIETLRLSCCHVLERTYRRYEILHSNQNQGGQLQGFMSTIVRRAFPDIDIVEPKVRSQIIHQSLELVRMAILYFKRARFAGMNKSDARLFLVSAVAQALKHGELDKALFLSSIIIIFRQKLANQSLIDGLGLRELVDTAGESRRYAPVLRALMTGDTNITVDKKTLDSLVAIYRSPLPPSLSPEAKLGLGRVQAILGGILENNDLSVAGQSSQLQIPLERACREAMNSYLCSNSTLVARRIYMNDYLCAKIEAVFLDGNELGAKCITWELKDLIRSEELSEEDQKKGKLLLDGSLGMLAQARNFWNRWKNAGEISTPIRVDTLTYTDLIEHIKRQNRIPKNQLEANNTTIEIIEAELDKIGKEMKRTTSSRQLAARTLVMHPPIEIENQKIFRVKPLDLTESNTPAFKNQCIKVLKQAFKISQSKAPTMPIHCLFLGAYEDDRETASEIYGKLSTTPDVSFSFYNASNERTHFEVARSNAKKEGKRVIILSLCEPPKNSYKDASDLLEAVCENHGGLTIAFFPECSTDKAAWQTEAFQVSDVTDGAGNHVSFNEKTTRTEDGKRPYSERSSHGRMYAIISYLCERADLGDNYAYALASQEGSQYWPVIIGQEDFVGQMGDRSLPRWTVTVNLPDEDSSQSATQKLEQPQINSDNKKYVKLFRAQTTPQIGFSQWAKFLSSFSQGVRYAEQRGEERRINSYGPDRKVNSYEDGWVIFKPKKAALDNTKHSEIKEGRHNSIYIWGNRIAKISQKSHELPESALLHPLVDQTLLIESCSITLLRRDIDQNFNVDQFEKGEQINGYHPLASITCNGHGTLRVFGKLSNENGTTVDLFVSKERFPDIIPNI